MNQNSNSSLNLNSSIVSKFENKCTYSHPYSVSEEFSNNIPAVKMGAEQSTRRKSQNAAKTQSNEKHPFIAQLEKMKTNPRNESLTQSKPGSVAIQNELDRTKSEMDALRKEFEKLKMTLSVEKQRVPEARKEGLDNKGHYINIDDTYGAKGYTVELHGTKIETSWIRRDPNLLESNQEVSEAEVGSPEARKMIRQRFLQEFNVAVIKLDELKIDWIKTRVELNKLLMDLEKTNTVLVLREISAHLDDTFYKITKAHVDLQHNGKGILNQARLEVAKSNLEVENLNIELGKLRTKVTQIAKFENKSLNQLYWNSQANEAPVQEPSHKEYSQDDFYGERSKLYRREFNTRPEEHVLGFMRGWLETQPGSFKERSELLESLVSEMSKSVLRQGELSTEELSKERLDQDVMDDAQQRLAWQSFKKRKMSNILFLIRGWLERQPGSPEEKRKLRATLVSEMSRQVLSNGTLAAETFFRDYEKGVALEKSNEKLQKVITELEGKNLAMMYRRWEEYSKADVVDQIRVWMEAQNGSEEDKTRNKAYFLNEIQKSGYGPLHAAFQMRDGLCVFSSESQLEREGLKITN